MDELTTFLEGIALPVIMSIFGGIAKTLSEGFKSWKQFVSSLFVSGFAGMIVHLFIQDSHLSPSMAAALVGLSGYAGVVILDGLTACAIKLLEKITGHSFRQKPDWNGVERRKIDGGSEGE